MDAVFSILRRAAEEAAEAEEEDECAGNGVGNGDDLLGLRIGSIFIIMVTSMAGALFPILARQSKWLHVPKAIFDIAKYFGSGVIIATSFIHLLAPALEALGSECLPEGWAEYPYALALCMLSIFLIFITELCAFRWGTAKLASLNYDNHGHDAGGMHAAHGPEVEDDSVVDAPTTAKDVDGVATGSSSPPLTKNAPADVEAHPHVHPPKHFLDSVATQILGIAILEFGVALHSTLIGLTLAVDEDFKILFIVLVFHQTFEGLGLGSRLAFLDLPRGYEWIPKAGAVLYGLTTPVGIAAGLGVRQTYSPGTGKALIVSGVMDSLSAGILIYTGLVELLAHEFLFNKEMMSGPTSKIVYAVGCMLLGCALMALLGRWA